MAKWDSPSEQKDSNRQETVSESESETLMESEKESEWNLADQLTVAILKRTTKIL